MRRVFDARAADCGITAVPSTGHLNSLRLNLLCFKARKKGEGPRSAMISAMVAILAYYRVP